MCSPNALIVIFRIIIADHVIKLVSSLVGQVSVEDIKPTIGVFHPSVKCPLAPPPHREPDVCVSMKTAEPKGTDCTAAGELFGCDVVICQKRPFFAGSSSCTSRGGICGVQHT